MTRVEVVTTHVDGRRVRTVIRPAAEAGTYHEHQETPTMPSPVKRSRRALEDALDRAATRVETTEQAYHIAAAEVTRLRESVETMRRDVRNAEAGEQAAHDAAAASARRMHELEGRAETAERSAVGFLPELARLRAAAIDQADRPLTADDITDEQQERARDAVLAMLADQEPRPQFATVKAGKIARAALRAALTPPPSRPEGAEAMDDHVRQANSAALGGALDPEQRRALADHLAAFGYRKAES